MTLPTLPTSSESLSYTDILTHFGNTSYTPHKLSDYYGAEEDDWFDPDAPQPSMIITATEGSDGFTSDDPTLSLTFTSNAATDNFVVGDITVSGGSISSFAATSSTVYTATFTAQGPGDKTIDVAADTFTASASGATNTVAAQFNWNCTYNPSTTTGRNLQSLGYSLR